MITLKTRATKTARTISWSEFKKGKIVEQSRLSFTPTTVIPDVLNDMILMCAQIDPEFKIKMLIPNSFTTASLDFTISGQGFQVTCSRRLVRGLFPFNPIAAECGGNYDVIFSIEATGDLSRQLENAISKHAYEE